VEARCGIQYNMLVGSRRANKGVCRVHRVVVVFVLGRAWGVGRDMDAGWHYWWVHVFHVLLLVWVMLGGGVQ